MNLRKSALFLVSFLLIAIFAVGGENPSKEEVWDEAVACGIKYEVPPEIIYSIAYVESQFHQFVKGKPFYYHGTYGIMQVLPKYLDFKVDLEKLKYDWRYNMEVGTKILISKWDMQNIKSSNKLMTIPKIGDGDRMVLESWYFSLWAYNSWGRVNNPNYRSTQKRKESYQDMLIRELNNRFGYKMAKLDKGLLPSTGLPKAGISFDYPEKNYSILKNIDINEFMTDYALKNGNAENTEVKEKTLSRETLYAYKKPAPREYSKNKFLQMVE